MITTHLQGGTGNQMFQFAMGFAQAARLNTSLRLDASSFRTDRMREYTLDLFPRITAYFKQTDDVPPATVHENGMPYNQKVVDSIDTNSILKGYWQTEKYFEKYATAIWWCFEPSPLTVKQRYVLQPILQAENSTFVTIRRTDYVGNSFHGELPLSYYEEALDIVAHKTGLPPDVFVFTDDIEWCRDNLKLPYPFAIAGTFDRTVKGHLGREDADLYLMSMCRNAVMANSSFSWWGAWLGEQKGFSASGVIVAPKKWFGPTSNEDPKDIVPKRWLTI